jgi:hypothetical protein
MDQGLLTMRQYLGSGLELKGLFRTASRFSIPAAAVVLGFRLIPKAFRLPSARSGPIVRAISKLL